MTRPKDNETAKALQGGGEPQNPHGDGQYIAILDGWRAVAILLVLLFHGFYNSDIPVGSKLTSLASLAGRTGALGVLIFFGISGFLITSRLRVETLKQGQFSVPAFYFKRILRIVPPLAVYLAVLCLLGLAHVIQLIRGDWAAPLFLTNYVYGSWYTTHFWSLSVEEHFYVFWPICILLAGWRRALWVGAVLILVVAVWRPWELRHAAVPARALQHTDMRLDYIMMGCVVALLIDFYPAFRKALTRLGDLRGLAVLSVALVLTTRSSQLDMRSVQALVLAVIVCSSAISDSRIPHRLLANRVMIFLGKRSYSLYIWQQLFLAPSRHAWLRSPAALPLKWAAALGVACLSYVIIERPFIKMGRRILMRRDERAMAQAI